MPSGTPSSSAAQSKGLDSDISQELSELKALSTDDQLGLLWKLYEGMGESITPAAPGAAEPQFTRSLLESVKAMDESAQLSFMRGLVNRKRTEKTAEYSQLSEDNKLVFWYELAEAMEAGTVVPVPEDYELPAGAAKLFISITALEFNQQITLLRQSVLDMGA